MKWEYKAIEVTLASSYIDVLPKQESDINKLGDEGWELISVVDNKFYFKRPIEQSVGRTLC